MATGSVAGGAGSHENGAGKHGSSFEEQFIAAGGPARFWPARSVSIARRIDAREHGIERHLLQNKAAVVAAVVDAMQVPLAEVVVGPLAGRMVEVVSAWVDGQFFKELWIEPGLVTDFRIGLVQD